MILYKKMSRASQQGEAIYPRSLALVGLASSAAPAQSADEHLARSGTHGPPGRPEHNHQAGAQRKTTKIVRQNTETHTCQRFL